MTDPNKKMEASNILVGVRQNEMIINGIVYCDTCWTTKPDDHSLCPCLADEVRTCEDCSRSKDPCLFCEPTHHANHKIAMAELDKVLASLEDDPTPVCATCLDKETNCERCGHWDEGHWDEDDPDYREHKYEY